MRNKIHRSAIMLALTAMVLRALLPAGWMPNPSGIAGSPFIICRMDMSVPPQTDRSLPVPMDIHDGHSGRHDQQQNNETCPFAAAQHLAPASSYAPILQPEPAYEASSPLNLGHAGAGAAHYSPQSPRAPPSFA